MAKGQAVQLDHELSPEEQRAKRITDADGRINEAVLRVENAERELRLARKEERDARARRAER